MNSSLVVKWEKKEWTSPVHVRSTDWWINTRHNHEADESPSITDKQFVNEIWDYGVSDSMVIMSRTTFFKRVRMY